jgi:ribonuclease P protein component
VVLARINDLEQPRLGLAIAKKKIRRAVDRNKLKRLIRESFRTHQILLTGLDLIVLKRSEDMSESNAQYLNSLSLHWEKLAGKCKLS